MRRRFGLVCFALLIAVAPIPAQQRGETHGAQSRHNGHAAGNNSLTLWKVANFALFAGVLGYLLRKRAGDWFHRRTEEIRAGITEAARLKREAEARCAEIEARLANLENEIEGLRRKAREETAAEEARIRRELQRDLTKIRAEAEREIAAAAKAARQQLRAYSAELAIRLAEAKIRRRLTAELDGAFFGSMLADLERKATGRPRAEAS